MLNKLRGANWTILGDNLMHSHSNSPPVKNAECMQAHVTSVMFVFSVRGSHVNTENCVRGNSKILSIPDTMVNIHTCSHFISAVLLPVLAPTFVSSITSGDVLTGLIHITVNGNEYTTYTEVGSTEN